MESNFVQKPLYHKVFLEQLIPINKIFYNNSIATSQDFVLFYAKDINSLKVNKKKSSLEGYYLEDEYLSTRGKYKLNKLHRGNIHYSEILGYPIKAPEGTEIWPEEGPNDKRWT